MFNLAIVAIAALLVGVLLGIVIISLLLAGRRDDDIIELNYLLQLWRNAFSSDTPEKAIYWINQLQQAGELRDIEQ